MFQPKIWLANFLLAEYLDEYPAGWYLVHQLMLRACVQDFCLCGAENSSISDQRAKAFKTNFNYCSCVSVARIP